MRMHEIIRIIECIVFVYIYISVIFYNSSSVCYWKYYIMYSKIINNVVMLTGSYLFVVIWKLLYSMWNQSTSNVQTVV